MFQKAKDLYALQKQAKMIKAELKNIHIESETNGVTITIDGEQEVINVTLPEEMGDKVKLEDSLKKALNKGLKKSQQIAAEKMRPIMSGVNLEGLSQ